MTLISSLTTKIGGSSMRVRSHKIYTRGLATALSLIIASTFTIIPVSASTSNELRESIGLPKNVYESTIDYTPNNSGVVDVEGKTDSESTAITEEDVEVETIIGYIDTNKDVSDYANNISQLETRLITRIGNCTNAYLITVTVDEIIEAKDAMNKLISSGNNFATDYIYESLTKPSEEDIEDDMVVNQYLSDDEVAKINSLDYDIGGIGDQAISVVQNYFRLVMPWGFNKHASQEEFTESKLLGMDLYTQPGDNIVSQWNGVIVGTYPDSSNKYQCIKIYHGNSTYTFYSHVYPVSSAAVGKAVRAGEVIGVAADTSEIEPNKENHIFYQVKLNGNYINPLLIYGNRGQKIYETWFTSHAYDNLIEAGEKYYNDIDSKYTGSVTPDEYKEDDGVVDVLYPDFNKEDIDIPEDIDSGMM